MKKLSILLIVFIMIFCACQSTPKPAPYVFEVSLKSPSVAIGEIEAQFDRTFPMPGIRKSTIKVSYFPIEDAVCLQWRMDTMTYYQFWSRDGREEFAKSLELYKADFEARSFGRSTRQSKRHYGTSTGYIIWQMFTYTIQAKAPNTVHFGYYFVDRSPYFVTLQRQVYYEDPMSRDNNRTIPEMPIYFTRAQADELLALFDDEFLNTVDSPSVRNTSVDFEDY